MKKIKWYDYLACIWFADIITAGLLSGNILAVSLGIFSYFLYEDWRTT